MLSQYYSIFTIWVVFTLILQKRDITIIKVKYLLLIIRTITQLIFKKIRGYFTIHEIASSYLYLEN